MVVEFSKSSSQQSELLSEILKLKKVIDRSFCSKSNEESMGDGSKSIEMISSGSSDAQTIEALHRLGGLSEISVGVLTKTKIGMSVGHLRKHPHGTISNLSKDLVLKWKAILTNQKDHPISSPRKRNSTSLNSRSPETTTTTITTTTTTSTKCGALQVAEPPPDDDNPSGGGGTPSPVVSCEDSTSSSSPGGGSTSRKTALLLSKQYVGPYCDNEVRDKARLFLWRALLAGVPPEQADAMSLIESCRLCARIEEQLYKRYSGLSREYNLQLKTLKWNLNDLKNPELNLKLYVGSITPEEVVQMDSKELASDEKKKEREKDRQESMQACQANWDIRNMKSREGQFPCGKCKSTKTVYFQMQTRSADEPMTTFVTCLDCGNRFKF